MEQGNIYVFDLQTCKYSTYFIVFKQLKLQGVTVDYLESFGNVDRVNDIKCHSTKLHRLLICYARTAVIVFSLNKNRAI